jgi:toxin ParE1/3/4
VRLRLLSDAREELRLGVAYYERERPGVGRRFLQQVRQMLGEIRKAPERFARRRARGIKEELRSVVLARFPYEIVFYCDPSDIVVVAVAHASRRPGYWRARLEEK